MARKVADSTFNKWVPNLKKHPLVGADEPENETVTETASTDKAGDQADASEVEKPEATNDPAAEQADNQEDQTEI